MWMTWIYILLVWICFIVDRTRCINSNRELAYMKLTHTAQFWVIVYITLVFTFRGYNVGPDTDNYYYMFQEHINKGFDYVFRSDAKYPEYLFFFVLKLCTVISKEHYMFFGVYGAFFAVTYGYIVHKNSKNYFITYLLFLSMYLGFTISGMRQVAAMSTLFLAYLFMKKNKLMPFLICVVAAYFFHNTAIVFALAYPFRNKAVGKVQFIFLLACLVLAYLAPEAANVILFERIGWDRLDTYSKYESGLSSSGLIIKSAILAFNIVFYKNTMKQDKNNLTLFNMSFLGVGFQAFTIIFSQAFRMSTYFSIFDTILTANTIECLRKNNDTKKMQVVIYLATIAACMLYYFVVSGSINYYIWKGVEL